MCGITFLLLLTFEPSIHLVDELEEQVEGWGVVVLPRVVRDALVEPALLVNLLAQVEDPVLPRVELVQESLNLNEYNKQDENQSG